MPAIQDFLSRTLRTGGIDEGMIGQNLNAMQLGGANARRDITAKITGSLPMGSSAVSGALTKGLGDEELANRQAMMQYLTGQQQTALGNRFGAVQGMEGLPSYIGQPSSIELAMMGARQPYDIANLGAQGDYWSRLLGGMQGSYYTPEMISQPSPWSSIISPILSAIIKGLTMGPAAGAPPVAHRGGYVAGPRMVLAPRMA